MHPVVLAALIALIATLSSALITGIVYLWRRDPVNSRPNVLRAMAEATQGMTAAAERMNAAHQQFLDRMGSLDERNREEHQAMLKEIRQLADIIAPRQPRRQT